MPLVLLGFLAFLFVEPIGYGATPVVWAVTFGSLAVFLVLYFAQWRGGVVPSGRRALLVLGIAALGFAVLPVNSGAGTYIIYAAAGAAFAWPPAQAAGFLAVLAAAAVVESVLVLPDMAKYWAAGFYVLLIGIVGTANIFGAQRARHEVVVRRADEDLKEMARVAERERIARDLHDLLGHTLSVITLKSELASKLADTDPQRAAVEIRDVERISRETLSEVRRAVEGYRHHGFKGELGNAHRALTAAGVRFDPSIASLDLPPQQETVLALALREAVTNVVRHAGATRCTVRLQADGRAVSLVVEDDGRGEAVVEGSGLAGMRARIAGAGGDLRVDAGHGVRLVVTLPNQPPAAVTAS